MHVGHQRRQYHLRREAGATLDQQLKNDVQWLFRTELGVFAGVFRQFSSRGWLTAEAIEGCLSVVLRIDHIELWLKFTSNDVL